jgi:hypothetical protein
MVTIEYTINENSTAPMTSLERRSYEHVVRQLLRLGSRPAVLLLHHYSWWGGHQPRGLFHKNPEADLTLFSHVSSGPLSGNAVLAFGARLNCAETEPPACRCSSQAVCRDGVWQLACFPSSQTVL